MNERPGGELSKAVQAVLDLCGETFASAKECMTVRKHRMFAGFRIDAACFDASMPSIGEVFVRQVLNEESDKVRSDRVRWSAKIYSERAKAIAVKQSTTA